MFEKELELAKRFVVGECYVCMPAKENTWFITHPAFYNCLITKRTAKTVWVRFAGDPGEVKQKRIQRDAEGNEYFDVVSELNREKWRIAAAEIDAEDRVRSFCGERLVI